MSSDHSRPISRTTGIRDKLSRHQYKFEYEKLGKNKSVHSKAITQVAEFLLLLKHLFVSAIQQAAQRERVDDGVCASFINKTF